MRVVATEVEVPLDCIRRKAGGAVRWVQGYSEDPEQEDTELFDEAVEMAKTGGKILYFMGQIPGTEMEGHDRRDLCLPAKQEKLLEKVLQVNPDVIVILTTPSPVVMPWIGQVKAVFECFLAGQAFGSALASLLYGEVNPSGKLPVSFPARLEDTSAYLFFPGDKKTTVYGEGVFVGYRYYDLKHTPLLFSFGHGLSYTTYTYSDLTLDRKRFGSQEKKLTLSVKIRNDGKHSGKETVQLYIGMFDEKVRRPVKELKGFRKVFLKSGEQQKIIFTLRKRDFAFYDIEQKEWRVPKGIYTIQIGASCTDIRLQEEIYVEPDHPYRKPLSGWSVMGELRETPRGEICYRKIRELLKLYMPENALLFPKEDLDKEEKLDDMPLRFVNLLTDGRLDNDTLLGWIEEINLERTERSKEKNGNYETDN